ncbi:hypothetical protein FPE49_004287 [Salmonella bongori]|uniref:hypothetical protein n=1 Tax=Salmonella bongori TaxID=54736 RepID=UPI0009AA6338|nr:hypothetical protein [Salmonella bongori]ECG1194912.1 hypothetical protein [Salmonella bongori]EDP8625974.1 hypothetical protein [Salmonella bongori]EGE4660895.1 hypothetical protein [Salmonella bongori serovar 48:i:- str. 94-0708]
MEWRGNCRVEANYGGEWVEATVTYSGRPDTHGNAVAWKEALVFDCKTTRPFWADEFRTIRSQVDKKRAESIDEITRAMGVFAVKEVGKDIYDAIAAGKIPHIRID